MEIKRSILHYVAASLVAAAMQASAATPSQWEFTGSLHIPRDYHTATLLSDGRVLVAGGAITPGTLPNRRTGTVEPTFPRHGHGTGVLDEPEPRTCNQTGQLR